MRPGPGAEQRSDIRDHERLRPKADRSEAQALVSLNEEQQRLLAVLRTQQNGMTARQLQASLAWPGEAVQSSLQTLQEWQVVARLNTIVPSYVYRHGGTDTGVW